MAEKNKERERPTFIEEARRKQIIESTIQTLSEKGYINTSLNDIADQIGVSKGVISYHFNGKDDLIDATLDTIVETQAALREKRVAEQDTPAKKFRAYFLANSEFMHTYPTYIPALIELWASYSTVDAKLHFNRKAYEPARLQLGSLFKAGQASGDFQDFDGFVMASLIQGGIDGVMFQWYFNPAVIDPDKYIAELLHLFEKSIVKDQASH